ncbi:glycosyltransferase family A protein [Dermabacteraceae bacterium P7006]
MSYSFPETTVVIACHSEKRDLHEAVASVLDHNHNVRVLVVAHNISADKLRARLEPQHRKTVHIVALNDGTRSPAGPFQKGLELVDTPFAAIMGSDDVLQPGAVDSWRLVQQHTGADYVITRLLWEGSRFGVPTPPARPHQILLAAAGRHRNLHPLKDRLVYRSAPLGLLSKEAISRLQLVFTPGLPVGEDVDFTTKLVLRASVAYDATGPAYLVRDRASDRTTFTPHPLPIQFGFFPHAFRPDMSPAEKELLALKFLRIHVFSALTVRDKESDWSLQDRIDLAEQVRYLLLQAPGIHSLLSLGEDSLLSACLSPQVPTNTLLARSRQRRKHLHPRNLLPKKASRILARQGPLRTIAASAAGMLLPNFLIQ